MIMVEKLFANLTRVDPVGAGVAVDEGLGPLWPPALGDNNTDLYPGVPT
jgi:hypothetical protein